MIDRLKQAGKILFGYQATQDKGRRQPAQKALRHENAELPRSTARKLNATAYDQYRNNALIAWMIRRHIDYVASFNFHFRSGKDRDFDKFVRSLFEWHGRAQNFDIAGRHNRDESMRLYELLKVTQGDAALIKLASGHTQGIEGDRIACPKVGHDRSKLPSEAKDVPEDGLIVDAAGRPISACICNRVANSSMLEFSHLEPWENLIYSGYFSRYDQRRGVSPLSSALNAVRDWVENWEYQDLKIKTFALFGLAFMRDPVAATGADWNQSDSDAEADEDDQLDSRRDVSFSPEKMLMLDLDEGEKVDLIESQHTPNPEIVSYLDARARIIMLALDIPFTAYDSMKSSFSARIADRQDYEKASRWKIAKNHESLKQYSDWKIAQWWLSDNIGLRARAEELGLTRRDIQALCDWIPSGSNWMDKSKEIEGDVKAIGAGLDSAPRVCMRRGVDYMTILEENREFLEAYENDKVPLLYGSPGQRSLGEIKKTETDTKSESNDA